MTRILQFCLVLVFVLVGCGDESDAPSAPKGPTIDQSLTPLEIRWEPDGDDFYRTPWPSDHRTLPGGQPDLSDYPGIEMGLGSTIRELLEEQVIGFSTMPVAYVELVEVPQDGVLPDARETTEEYGGVVLMNVSEVFCGERVPLEITMGAVDDVHSRTTAMQIAPVPGFVLRQGQPYALMVLQTLGNDAGFRAVRPDGFSAALDGSEGGELAESLDALRRCARTARFDLDLVAVASVFTTQDILGEARALREAVLEADAPQINDIRSSSLFAMEAGAPVWVGTYDTPIFHTGQSPYQSMGGSFVFEDGRPVVQQWEEVPFIVIAPEGNGPFPLLFYEDGTGWGQWSHVGGSVTREALEVGFAVVSFMPQFHGERATPGSDEALSTYNFANPAAGRNVLRQQLADAVYFLRVLREELANDNSLPELDTDRIVFFGQSQGSQNGAFLGAVEPRESVRGYVLNGLASYLSITVLERKDILDFESLVKLSFGVDNDTVIDRHHPVVHILQLGADSVDPHNYVPGWSGWPGRTGGVNALVINGFNDTTTAPVGMNAVTIAADVAPVDPPGWDVDPFDVWNRTPESTPLSGNRISFEGDEITLATILDGDEGHFTIYNVASTRQTAIQFLVSSANNDVPEVR